MKFHRKPLSRRLSQSEGFAHIESYFRSGLRPSEYYQRHAISEWQFYSWRRRYLALHPEMSSPSSSDAPTEKRFHEVIFHESPSVTSGFGSGLEIHYPHGVKVVVDSRGRLDMETLYSLIKLRV